MNMKPATQNTTDRKFTQCIEQEIELWIPKALILLNFWENAATHVFFDIYSILTVNFVIEHVEF